MKLWLAGRVPDLDNPKAWELIGVYDSKEKAIKACREPNDFWAGGNVVLNTGQYGNTPFAESGWPLFDD